MPGPPTTPTPRSQRSRVGIHPSRSPLGERDEPRPLEVGCRSCDPTTGLLCICNPNNPTGTAIARRRAIARPRPPVAHSRSWVLLDEAYCEFNDDQRWRSIELVEPRPPRPDSLADVLQSLRPRRSAGRLCAFAAPRRGWLTSWPRELPSFPVSDLGSVRRRGGTGPPRESSRSPALVATATRQRARLSRRSWRSSGLKPAQSHANFVWLAAFPTIFLTERWPGSPSRRGRDLVALGDRVVRGERSSDQLWGAADEVDRLIGALGRAFRRGVGR